jgi:hypothetical protein
MIFFELMATIALMVGDVCAVLSVAGSGILLLLAIVAGQRSRASEQVWWWSLGGLILGTAGLVSLVVTGNKAKQIGVFFGFSKSTIGLLLLLSLGLLVVRMVVRPR